MHPLKGKLAVDVDDAIGIGNLGGVRIDGRKLGVAFFEPIGAGGDAPRANIEEIDEWRSFGRLAGLRVVTTGWHWDDRMTGSEAAKKASDYIASLETNNDGTLTRRIDVMEYDVETHDRDWQKEFLLGRPRDNTKGIRGRGGFLPDPERAATLGYRWGRPGVWTMEGRQDTSSSEAALAAAAGLLVGPQLYNGAMTEVWDWHFELLTWVLNANPDRPAGARIPITQMIPYYDARTKLTKDAVARFFPDPFVAPSLLPSGANEAVLFSTSRLSAV